MEIRELSLWATRVPGVNGFSCRQQIAHGTRRQAMHSAEVLQLALKSAQSLPVLKKRRFIEEGRTQPKPRIGILGALLGVGIIAAGFLLIRKRNRFSFAIEGHHPFRHQTPKGKRASKHLSSQEGLVSLGDTE